MTPTRTASRAVFLGSSLLLATGSGAWGQTAPAPGPIVVAAIGSTDVLPFFYALREGAFARAGLDVTLQQTPSGVASVTAVVGGAAQIGFSNTLALCVAYGRGIPVELVAPGFRYDVRSPNVTMLVAAGGPVRTAKDLEGRVVAVTGLHDLMAVSTAAWLRRAGADASRVKFVEMPSTAMAAALEAKRVDAVTTYDPYVGLVQAAGGRVFAHPDDVIGGDFLAGGWFALRPWADGHRDELRRFAAVIHDSAGYTNAHWEELIPLISSYSKMSPDLLRTMGRPRVPPALTPALLQPIVDFAAANGELAHAFPAREMLP